MATFAGPAFPLRVALAGAGRVGTAVAELLRRRGHAIVAVASRTAGSAERAAGYLRAPVASFEGLPPADVVLIGARDDAIEEVAGRFGPAVAAGTVLWHFAGSLGIDVLEEAVAGGALACAVHPVQACPDVDSAVRRLPGSAWGITCSPPIVSWVHRVVREELGGVGVDVPAADRPIWHAAAVTTSNGIAALLEGGEAMLRSIGISGVEVLTPLARGTVLNAHEAGGGGAALTGPLVRGEIDTLRRHVTALRDAPDLLETYVGVARVVLAAARRTRRLSDAAAASIEDVLAAAGP